MTTTVIIGAARGIGRAIAEDAAGSDRKRRLVVADVDAEGVQRLAAELVREGSATRTRTVQPIIVFQQSEVSTQ
jgi:NAD(P)-dependent dehydrogenase (short-subunit alcohol dehydrogenase family)